MIFYVFRRRLPGLLFKYSIKSGFGIKTRLFGYSQIRQVPVFWIDQHQLGIGHAVLVYKIVKVLAQTVINYLREVVLRNPDSFS